MIEKGDLIEHVTFGARAVVVNITHNAVMVRPVGWDRSIDLDRNRFMAKYRKGEYKIISKGESNEG